MILPGDIYYIPVPFKQDFFKSKPRPVVVLRDEGSGLFLVAPITGTNHTGYRNGIWILKDSIDGKKMELEKDSFIVVQDSFKYPSFGLMEYWGHCHLVEELLSKL